MSRDRDQSDGGQGAQAPEPAGSADNEQSASQPALFELGAAGRFQGFIGVMPDLTASSSLEVARYWFRRHLEQAQTLPNTLKSYTYDLALFEQAIGPKPLERISRRDVAHFLDQSRTRSTRKRRLTTLSTFFKYLIATARVLERDPTEGFYPDPIPLKTPRPLFPDEQARLLAAAEQDSPRAHIAVWLMLRLGLTRIEVLELLWEEIDRSVPERPVVYIFIKNGRKRGRERHLAAGPELSAFLARLEAEGDGTAGGKLIPILPQSLNKLVDRVAEAAELKRPVSPQTLRDTFAVEQARAGASEDDLLQLLGLADDARNRLSVQRYLKLAAPPLVAASP